MSSFSSQVSQQPFYVYVDFDSTLFDTPRFAADLWQLFASHVNLPLDQIKTDGSGFQIHDKLRSYDYERHLQLYALHSAAMWDELRQLLNTNNYLYNDSASFMQTLQSEGYMAEILSFGETRFQAAKIEANLAQLCGHRNAFPLPYTIVQRRKREYIAETKYGASGVLVDDVPGQNLPTNFCEIELNRNLELTAPLHKKDGYIVNDLRQAYEVIAQLGPYKV